MKQWFNLSDNNKRDIFNQVSISNGLPAFAIEKDWWVTNVLRIIFSLPVSEHLIFKGGTSLSKGWNLIERFSEDIDLVLDRKLLGFKDELSKTQIGKLRKASCTFISNEFVQIISEKIHKLEIPDILISVQELGSSDKDPVIIEIAYSTVTEESSYLKPKVLIEVGSRSLFEPTEKINMQSFVDEFYHDKPFALQPISVPTVLPKRTFLEKAFLLHEEFQKPVDQIRVNRLSRHLYDLDKLMDSDHGKEALQDFELYKSIVDHREKFNAIRGIDYSNHRPDKLNIIPPVGIIKKWEEDYKSMQESMIYGESRTFSDLISRMKELNERFKEIIF
ncbi:MAG: nucleotidyl transferase AbiEii/AbiGii toxin family protein [Candidatus Delongbacteria bacterium]|jgi:predicted nucleotidyltransferase component of viral defense system|nr:nucleotidyl transferase AbiEii/AbiGii toxin family protein [Candidatus Delongbacteria bacterium]